MIVVDSSVWIDFLRGIQSHQVLKLKERVNSAELVIGDLILCEILRGVRNEGEAVRINERLSQLAMVNMVGRQVAERSAMNYRLLRSRGVTLRNTIDLLIGTFCILNDLRLLHNDRDFVPMVKHLGLLEA